jgi:DNA helicase II / ATP-dependent DNA helicase PcrA
MTNDLLKQLNPKQQEAVLQTEGSMIILAGAGSGKTRVLTHKVLYLMTEKKITSESILMITFTNKAATEMKERMQKFHQGSMPWISTFHSLCAKLLRIEGTQIGLSPRFIIYDTQDQLDAIKQAMKQLNIAIKDVKPRSVQTTISGAKNELIDATDYQTIARGNFQETIAKIYPIYQKILQENDAVDFDDLLLQTITLFRKNKQILQIYQKRFQYILVDEYQDTNRAQYLLTKFLAGHWGNICVVGDFSQSIYSWRGADYRNLMKFTTDFPAVKTFALAQNYRSTQKILDAATAVITKNKSHPVLELWTENPMGDAISLFEARNEQEEADFIIRRIATINLTSLTDVAVLYRTNAQSRVLEEALLHHAVPYVLVGGTRFYERKEIKDVLCYLRLLNNPNDSISYQRAEKIGKRRLIRFLAFQQGFLLEQKEQKNEKSKEWLAEGESQTEDKVTIDFLDEVLQATQYLELYDEKIEEERARLENIKELRSVAISFPDLTDFLENVALVEQEYSSEKQKQGEKKNAITLMTLHAAKGLEFPIVFMIGMEEGLFPHSRTLMERDELEEERRLCYVGMTRAKKKLFLTYARRRLFFGQRTTNVVSRFVSELPKEIIKQDNGAIILNDEEVVL